MLHSSVHGTPVRSRAKHSPLIQGCQSTGLWPQSVLDHNELKQRRVTWFVTTSYSHQDLITIQTFQHFPTHTELGRQQAGIFLFDSLCCSIIRCHQAPQQLLWHPPQGFHHEALGTFLRCAIVECLYICE